MLALTSCGDDEKAPDAPRSVDAPNADAASFPAAPSLGTQIDRMGRPAINTALNDVFAPAGTAKTAAKDTYNQDAGPSNWQTMFVPLFVGNLAVFDALDKGFVHTGSLTVGDPSATGKCKSSGMTCQYDKTCTTAGDYCLAYKCDDGTTACGRNADCGTGHFCLGQACGNQVEYNGMLAGDATYTPHACFAGSPPTYQADCSYAMAAGLLADDQLYLDTTQTTCSLYLAVEFDALMPGIVQDCGGRAPTYDVMDVTYSLVAAGLAGLDLTNNFAPKISDGVSAHADISTTFPFFGAPH
ncbi:MAG TPA: hypothetical protein VMJ10_21270 [Kofleriaceae bacterium]|nr:hypothetical protein [Kofleriaceae bacterium]